MQSYAGTEMQGGYQFNRQQQDYNGQEADEMHRGIEDESDKIFPSDSKDGFDDFGQVPRNESIYTKV